MIANVDKLTKIVTFIKLLIVQNAYLNIYIINRKCLKIWNTKHELQIYLYKIYLELELIFICIFIYASLPLYMHEIQFKIWGW